MMNTVNAADCAPLTSFLEIGPKKFVCGAGSDLNVNMAVSGDYNACHLLCQQNQPLCEWFEWDSVSGNCDLKQGGCETSAWWDGTKSNVIASRPIGYV